MTVQEKREALKNEMVGLEAIEEILSTLKREKEYNAMVWRTETETFEEAIKDDWNYEDLHIKSKIYNDIITMIEKKYL